MCKISLIENGLTITKNRITLTLAGTWIGRDLLIIITGGDAHIGSCALACLQGEVGIHSCRGHKESELAGSAGTIFSGALHCNVAVICGIHYNNITKMEIEDILGMTKTAAEKYAALLAQASPPRPGGR